MISFKFVYEFETNQIQEFAKPLYRHPPLSYYLLVEGKENMSEQQEKAEADPELSAREVEKREEEKLKAKYPSGLGGPHAVRGAIGGHSAFLQKRLAKGQKFFDSGDYQMAKQKVGGVNKPPLKTTAPMNPYATGEAIPTPETVPARKTSIIQPSKFSTNNPS